MESELQSMLLENRKKKIKGSSDEILAQLRQSHIPVEDLVTLGYIDYVADLKEIALKEFEDCKIQTDAIPRKANLGTGNIMRVNTFSSILGNRFLSA